MQVRNITNEEDNAAEVLQNLLEQQELSVESVVMEESTKPGGGKQRSAIVRLAPPPLPWLRGPEDPVPSVDAGGEEGDITKVSPLAVLQPCRSWQALLIIQPVLFLVQNLNALCAPLRALSALHGAFMCSPSSCHWPGVRNEGLQLQARSKVLDRPWR